MLGSFPRTLPQGKEPPALVFICRPGLTPRQHGRAASVTGAPQARWAAHIPLPARLETQEQHVTWPGPQSHTKSTQSPAGTAPLGPAGHLHIRRGSRHARMPGGRDETRPHTDHFPLGFVVRSTQAK